MVDRSEVDRLTRDLTDEGRLIEAGWIGLRLMSLPADAPAVQVEELRDMFFAGAHHLLYTIMTMLEPGEDPSTADLGRMAKLQSELDAFIDDFDLRRLGTEGSA